MITLRTTKSPRIFKPLCMSLFGSCESAISYLDRYTLDTKNPVMKMKDGVTNRKYR